MLADPDRCGHARFEGIVRFRLQILAATERNQSRLAFVGFGGCVRRSRRLEACACSGDAAAAQIRKIHDRNFLAFN